MAKRNLSVHFERTTAIIVASGLVVSLGAYFGLLSPMQSSRNSEVTTLSQLAKQISSLEQHSHDIASGNNSVASMYQHDLILDQLLPVGLDQASEFIALDSSMNSFGLVVNNFSSITPTTTSPDPSVPGARAMQFAFMVQGNVNSAIAWLNSLYTGPVLITTTNVKLVAGNSAVSGSGPAPVSATSSVVLSGTILVWQSTVAPLPSLGSSSGSSAATGPTVGTALGGTPLGGTALGGTPLGSTGTGTTSRGSANPGSTPLGSTGTGGVTTTKTHRSTKRTRPGSAPLA